MERRKFVTNVSTFTLFAFLMNGFESCTSSKIPKSIILPENAGFQMDYIRKGVGFFTERGGTIGWFMSPEGVVVIDTQFPEQSNHLIDQFKTYDLNQVKHVINTHHHGDHTAGNIAFSELTNSIIAHENSKKNQMESAESNGNQELQLYPTETFKEQKTLKVANETLDLQYFGPAHTDGDIVIHFQNANVAHIGDLLFNRRFPYIDKGHGASIENWIQVLDSILKTYDDETIFMWGHARDGFPIQGGKDPIKAFKNYLENLLEIGRKAFQSGRSKEEFLAMYQQVPNAPEWQGDGIERSLDAVWQEMNEGR